MPNSEDYNQPHRSEPVRPAWTERRARVALALKHADDAASEAQHVARMARACCCAVTQRTEAATALTKDGSAGQGTRA